MKVAHVVKRIEMIDDDIRQLKRLESQLSKNKKYANPIIMSIEKQINLLLAERIKYLDLKIENPPAFMVDDDEDSRDKKKEITSTGPTVSRIKQRKKKGSETPAKKAKTDKPLISTPSKDIAAKAKSIPDTMLTQEMIDKKFEEARKKLLEEADDSEQKKKGISGTY